MTRLKVLLASSEVFGYAKVGGLGDVAYSLPKALRSIGVDARIIAPMHKERKKKRKVASFDVKIGENTVRAHVYLSRVGTIPLYLVSGGNYFPRESVYGYADDFERYLFFSKAIVEFVRKHSWKPDVLHLNDWHTGLAAAYVKAYNVPIKTLFTIHNLGYQGDVDLSLKHLLNLEDEYIDEIVHNGRINPMKAGILMSDAVNTVSEKYAEEIQTPEFGFGLDSVLRSVRDKLYGITNGIDYSVWNPKTDPYIYKRYSTKNLDDKHYNKRMLMSEMGLEYYENKPLIGIVSRLAHQKGIDVFLSAIEEFIRDKKLSLIILGTGEKPIEDLALRLQEEYSSHVKAVIRYDEVLAHKIYAGSDIFAVPSRYEPCGLTQMIAMRYGSVPIVRNTGGLSDTVIDPKEDKERARGFKFEKLEEKEVKEALERVLDVFERDKDYWRKIQINGMTSDFSWRNSARKYVKLYTSLLSS